MLSRFSLLTFTLAIRLTEPQQYGGEMVQPTWISKSLAPNYFERYPIQAELMSHPFLPQSLPMYPDFYPRVFPNAYQQSVLDARRPFSSQQGIFTQTVVPRDQFYAGLGQNVDLEPGIHMQFIPQFPQQPFTFFQRFFPNSQRSFQNYQQGAPVGPTQLVQPVFENLEQDIRNVQQPSIPHQEQIVISTRKEAPNITTEVNSVTKVIVTRKEPSNIVMEMNFATSEPIPSTLLAGTLSSGEMTVSYAGNQVVDTNVSESTAEGTDSLETTTNTSTGARELSEVQESLSMFTENATWIIELDDQSFDELVLRSPKFWAVAMYKRWSPFSKQFAPFFKKLTFLLKGVLSAGALDLEVDTKYKFMFNVTEHPSVLLFFANKSAPVLYPPKGTKGIVPSKLANLVVQTMVKDFSDLAHHINPTFSVKFVDERDPTTHQDTHLEGHTQQ